MPVCKNCGARISKFDNDMCPICGTKKPLEGVTSETIEITSEINLGNPEFKAYKQTKRSVMLVLFVFLGIFGTGFFYAKFKKLGLFWLICNLVFIGGVGSILAFMSKTGILWGYLIPLFIAYGFNMITGLFLFLKHDMKDGNGEFIH